MLIDRSSPPRIWKMPKQPKPLLKMQTVPVFRVHYEDLERYIRLVFGFEFDYLFAEGVALNGPCLEYEINGRYATAQEKMVSDLREGSRIKNVPLILNVLAKDGYIEPGRYLIETRKRQDVTEVYRTLLGRTDDPDCEECRAFKHEHRNNTVFMERVVVLEAALADQKTRGKR